MKINDIELQPASLDTWSKKYRLRDLHGDPIDADVGATMHRVATELASVELTPKRASMYKSFMGALERGALPAGRILSNAGATEHKKSVSTINCVVSDTIPDSMDGILGKLVEAGMSLKSGCGIGYEFSTLRPRGSFVHGAGSVTSGPLSFMDIYDKTCFTVSSAGGRRGAQMATFDIHHPDVLDFIKAKRTDGALRQFNLSLLITDEFVAAVNNDTDWHFTWDGKTHGAPIRARELWDVIMSSNYNFAEPGFLLIDRINRLNNLWFCENLRATNPCGEQPLPPYGSCLLGSINIVKFVRDPFTQHSQFDFEGFEDVVRVFTRMLDNVVELSGLPLKQQLFELQRKRRHGMGYTGLGSAMAMLGIKYGSPESIEFTELVTKRLAIVGFEAGAELAAEKGEAPVLAEEFTYAQIRPFSKFNSNVAANFRGTRTGRSLLLNSHYFDQWHDDPDCKSAIAAMKKHGSRFSHHSSIAPTGTISLSLANNVSSGIEPTFAHSYSRNIIREGRNVKENIQVMSFEYLAYKTLVNPEAIAEVHPTSNYPQSYSIQDNRLPATFITTDDLVPSQHIDIQAAAQKWIDSSISKTINVPSNTKLSDFQDIYLYAHKKGLKGCTTFRFNPEAFQGVLVKDEDLKNTNYVFHLDDGTTTTLSGDTEVEYLGQTQTAANLFDAIKENYFGKL